MRTVGTFRARSSLTKKLRTSVWIHSSEKASHAASLWCGGPAVAQHVVVELMGDGGAKGWEKGLAGRAVWSAKTKAPASWGGRTASCNCRGRPYRKSAPSA